MRVICESFSFLFDIIKNLFNTLAIILQKKIFTEKQLKLSIHDDPEFAEARLSRSVKRKLLQKDPSKLRQNTRAFTAEEARETVEQYSPDHPGGLNRRFFQIASKLLAWRGNEGANWRVEYFKFEECNKTLWDKKISWERTQPEVNPHFLALKHDCGSDVAKWIGKKDPKKTRKGKKI